MSRESTNYYFWPGQEPEYGQLMLPQYVIRMVKNPLLLAHGIVHWRKYSPVQQSSFTEQCRYLSEFAKVEAKIAKPKQAERQENPRRRRNKGPLRRQKSWDSRRRRRSKGDRRGVQQIKRWWVYCNSPPVHIYFVISYPIIIAQRQFSGWVDPVEKSMYVRIERRRTLF